MTKRLSRYPGKYQIGIRAEEIPNVGVIQILKLLSGSGIRDEGELLRMKRGGNRS